MISDHKPVNLSLYFTLAVNDLQIYFERDLGVVGDLVLDHINPLKLGDTEMLIFYRTTTFVIHKTTTRFRRLCPRVF